MYQFRRGSMPSRIYSMSFNTTSTLLCVSSATETVHIFKLGLHTDLPRAPNTPFEEKFGSPSKPSNRPRDRSQSPDNESPPGTAHSGGSTDISAAAAAAAANRKHNGTFMGMIRRTSQNVGTSFAASIGGYLPSAVAEMWEPARDFAWLKIPKTAAAGGGSSSAAPLRSVVAMSSNSPQVMVVTNEGNFYVFNIDLERGGEGTLTRQYSVLDSNDKLGASVMDD